MTAGPLHNPAGRDYKTPQVDYKTPLVGGKIPQAGGKIPQAGGKIPQAGGKIPHTGGKIPHTGGKIPHIGDKIPHIDRTILEGSAACSCGLLSFCRRVRGFVGFVGFASGPRRARHCGLSKPVLLGAHWRSVCF